MLSEPVNNASAGSTMPGGSITPDCAGATATDTGTILIIDGEPMVVVNNALLPQLIVDESLGELGAAGASENAAGFDTMSLSFAPLFDSDSVAAGVQTNFAPDLAGFGGLQPGAERHRGALRPVRPQSVRHHSRQRDPADPERQCGHRLRRWHRLLHHQP